MLTVTLARSFVLCFSLRFRGRERLLAVYIISGDSSIRTPNPYQEILSDQHLLKNDLLYSDLKLIYFNSAITAGLGNIVSQKIVKRGKGELVDYRPVIAFSTFG